MNMYLFIINYADLDGRFTIYISLTIIPNLDLDFGFGMVENLMLKLLTPPPPPSEENLVSKRQENSLTQLKKHL